MLYIKSNFSITYFSAMTSCSQTYMMKLRTALRHGRSRITPNICTSPHCRRPDRQLNFFLAKRQKCSTTSLQLLRSDGSHFNNRLIIQMLT